MTRKHCSGLLVLLSLSAVVFSFYIQYGMQLEPCPLCMMQRVCVFGLLAVSMGLYLKNSPRTPFIWSTYFFFVVAGIYFAGRQLWLQSLPPDAAPACMPGLDVLLSYYPLKVVIHQMILGSGDCALVDISWLGLSLAGWSLVFFIVMSLSGLTVLSLSQRMSYKRRL